MARPFSRPALVPVVSVWLALSALCCSLPALAAEITPQQVSDRITVFYGAGGNVVVHESDDGLLLVDGGAPEHSADLLAAIDRHYDAKPVELLVNTHWHLEQTGSNDTLGAAGVTIIAHENTRRWMMTTIEQYWNGPVFEPRSPSALPTQTFYIEHSLSHGDETIRLRYTPRAHTDGDIIAIFDNANVIAAGGTAYEGSYPVLDTATNGWIGELLDATRTLLAESDENTLIIPADGAVMRREALSGQETMLATLMDRFRSMSRQGKGAEDMLQEGIADEFIEDRGDPEAFILTAWDGLWDHMRGLGAF